MKKRFLEEIYEIYLKDIEEEGEFIKKFENETKKSPNREKEIDKEFGSVYFVVLDGKSFYFIMDGEIEEKFYQGFVGSIYIELANQNDFITTDPITKLPIIVETWNEIYLTEEELKDAIYLGKLPEEDIEILWKFVNKEIKELPYEKRGLTPLSENAIQYKFHEKESERFRYFKLRLLLLIDDDYDCYDEE